MMCLSDVCAWEPDGDVVPDEWTCSADAYDDAADVCDCGCGVIDPDCESGNPAVCDVCDGAGSCSEQACPGEISVEDSAVCG